jgi:hypothetical protein
VFYSVLEKLDVGFGPSDTSSVDDSVSDGVQVTAGAECEREHGHMRGVSDASGECFEKSQAVTCRPSGVATGNGEGGNGSKRSSQARELVPNELAVAEFDSMLASRSS